MKAANVGRWLIIVGLASSCQGQGFENVALKKNCSQSTFLSFDHHKPCNAANNNTNGTLSDDNCICTSPNDNSPWWEVDLGRAYPILNITIFGLTNYEKHLEGTTIRVDGQECARIVSVTSREVHVNCSSTLYGRTVRISKQSPGNLMMCEFQVWECKVGKYGLNCTDTCGQCKDKKTCDKVTGRCEDGCLPGWRGDRCKEECEDGKYGLTCNNTCGQCKDNKPCHKVTGRCKGGCLAGWRGVCMEECKDGKYGPNCTETCGKCKDKNSCDKATGLCKGECLPGWRGSRCKNECDDGTYGPNCIDVCGECKVDTTCDKVTGHCESGCAPPFYGYRCKQAK